MAVTCLITPLFWERFNQLWSDRKTISFTCNNSIICYNILNIGNRHRVVDRLKFRKPSLPAKVQGRFFAYWHFIKMNVSSAKMNMPKDIMSLKSKFFISDPSILCRIEVNQPIHDCQQILSADIIICRQSTEYN